MKVTHLSWWDISGGAARSAFRLHQGLQRLGHDSRMLVQYKGSDDPTVIAFAPPLDLGRRIRRIVRRNYLKLARRIHYSRRPLAKTFFSDDRSEHSADALNQSPLSDILHLHWIAEFIDYSHFFSQLNDRTPLVWTLHDMNPMTGGCHHAEDCTKFKNVCGACPQLGSSATRDFSTEIWTRKRNAYKKGFKRFSVVTPSRWLAGKVQQSALLADSPLQVIPYGLDTDSFRPHDREMARNALSVPQDANVLLFVSAFLDDKYKGAPYLVEVIHRLRTFPKLFLLIIGHGKLVGELPVPSKSLGFYQKEEMLALAYSAADLFVLPSLQDNFPNTALESLACGLPVAAFNVGGVPEIVIPGSTGVLAESGDSEGLALAIERLLSEPAQLRQFSENCRRIALEEYDLQIQAKRYIELYTSLLT